MQKVLLSPNFIYSAPAPIAAGCYEVHGRDWVNTQWASAVGEVFRTPFRYMLPLLMKYPYYDYVWIASDSEGHLAAFVTAGEGPIPAPLLSLDGNPIAEIERWLLELPVLGEPTMLQSCPKPDSFIELGKRGVLVFDWSDVHRTDAARLAAYELVCKPKALLKVADLPDALRKVTVVVGTFDTVFEKVQTLHPGTFVDCVEPTVGGMARLMSDSGSLD